MKVFKKLKDKMMALMRWKGLEMPWRKRKPNLKISNKTGPTNKLNQNRKMCLQPNQIH